MNSETLQPSRNREYSISINVETFKTSRCSGSWEHILFEKSRSPVQFCLSSLPASHAPPKWGWIEHKHTSFHCVLQTLGFFFANWRSVASLPWASLWAPFPPQHPLTGFLHTHKQPPSPPTTWPLIHTEASEFCKNTQWNRRSGISFSHFNHSFGGKTRKRKIKCVQ